MRLARDLRILLPFAAVIASWWAIKDGLNVSNQLLASPPQVWSGFIWLTTHGIIAEYARIFPARPTFAINCINGCITTWINSSVFVPSD